MAKTLIVLLLAIANVAWAQAMRDPTQPPGAYSAAAGTLADDESLPPETPVLNTIIRRHGAKPIAVINGETVALGGKVGDWRLVRIGESEAVLRGADGKETLTLSPGVDKRPVRAASGRATR